MEYLTPKCPVCKQTSDRCPLRIIGEAGIKFELSEDGTAVVPVHANLYQCTGCKSVFMVHGELKPTRSPLAEVPLAPRELREVPMTMAATRVPPPDHPVDGENPVPVSVAIPESKEEVKIDADPGPRAGRKASTGTGKK